MPYYSVFNKMPDVGRMYLAYRFEAKSEGEAKKKGQAENRSWANAIKRRFGKKPPTPKVVKVVKLKNKPRGWK